jgi:hypothetical protein
MAYGIWHREGGFNRCIGRCHIEEEGLNTLYNVYLSVRVFSVSDSPLSPCP